ncbi:MAG: ATP synthase subunit I [Acidimicrobiales bacterium]
MASEVSELAPERQIAADMMRRALPVAPVLIVVSGLIWGTKGAWSAAFALALVLVNLGLSAVSLAWAAKVSPSALMATALGGFLLRMLLIVGAITAVRGESWVAPLPLGICVVAFHVGLLIWESRHVSASLAFPGLKPRRTGV